MIPVERFMHEAHNAERCGGIEFFGITAGKRRINAQ
jgi:hypothetical protein